MRVVVGLGANLPGHEPVDAADPRLATMREAVLRLGRIARVARASRVFETAPVGGPPQGDYLNAAVLVAWDRSAEALLDELLRIERELGRERRERWGPRVIDLDVLWIDGAIVDSPRVVVPHPRLLERAFAILPLLDVAPGAIDPRTGAVIVVPPVDANAVRATSHRLDAKT